jgi:voltage-gated potassium channel
VTYLSRAFVRFQKNPSSIRYAAGAIITTILVLVFLGAVLIQLLAPEQFTSFGDALWFTLQTVTTVGYGDGVPTSIAGRLVAGVVMLVSIGLISVITAGITSMFIRSLNQEQTRADQQALADSLTRIEASLASAHERLDQLANHSNDGRNDA